MSDWCEISIGENIKITSGFPFPSQYFAEEGFPLIRIRDINSSSTEVYFSGEVPSGYVIKRGDVLVGMDGDFHVVKWKGADALLNQRVMKIDVFENSALDVKFLYHWLGPFIQKINETTAATTVKHLSTKDLIKAKAYLPNLTVQKKIAAALNGVDAVIEKTEALIEKYQQIKAGLMHDLFTRGVQPDGKLRPIESAKKLPHGWLPHGWRIGSLLEVTDSQRQPILTGPFGADLGNSDFVAEGIPVLRIGNVQQGRLDLSDLLYVSTAKADSLGRYKIKSGDLLFARQGATTGRNALADDQVEGVLINYHIIRVALDHQLCSPLFVEAAFASDMVKRQIERDKGRGTREGINTSQLTSLDFPIAPVEEQRLIAKMLGKQNYFLRALEKDRENLLMKKAGLMHDLLTGKVAVKVDEAQEEHV